jgi:hypothetical protein
MPDRAVPVVYRQDHMAVALPNRLASVAIASAPADFE